MKVLLDEHFPSVVAEQLRARGHDCIAVTERPDLRGRSDPEIYAVAVTEGRWIVTENVVDFVPIHAEALGQGEVPAGLILTSNRRFPRGRAETVRALIAALSLLLEGAEPATGGVVWL